MRRLPAALLAWIFTVTSAALGQRTWIVDASNPPGTDFTNLPPALLAASDGDTILVRSGVYDPAVTSRGVTLLGFGATIVARPIGGSGLERALLVDGLPHGHRFVMRGFQLQGPATNQHAAEIRSCAGVVVLANVHASPGQGDAHSLRISESADVSVLHSTLSGGLRASGSRVWLRDTHVYGPIAQSRFGSLRNYAQPACVGSQSEISVCGGSLIGGHGLIGLAPDQSAMQLEDCTTRLATGSGLFLRTGSYAGTLTFVISANGGTLDLDPSIPLSIGGNSTVSLRRVPAMNAAPTSIGSVLSLDLYAVPGDAFQIFLGLRADPIALGAFGTLWIEPSALFVVGSGTLDAFGSTSRGILVPNDPWFQGIVMRAQALRYGAAGTSLTDPATVLIY
ncbi:MAG: hypothetical protein IPN34_23920 [Planctomycetes bacterium]|nr:hypothetical protein [Planctomycetota bacterium]